MDLIKQCAIWNEKEEYQTIIDAIEALPKAQQTPQLISELARAYNNRAQVGDRALFERALELLQSVEEHFKDEHNWNFRTAYAYYYLDEEGLALRYFEKALEARPGDEDTLEFLDDCRRRLAMPRFEKTFRQRTLESWEAFVAGEEELRGLIDRKNQAAVGEELIKKCEKLLAPAFYDVAFELGFNGEKYELILTPEGNRAKLFELVFFQRRAPKSLLERWNVLVGRQPSQGFGLRAFGQEIAGRDVQVWVKPTDSGQVSLAFFCEKLLPMLKEDENKVWWMLSILLDQVLGEIPAMSLIAQFDVLDAPGDESGVLMDRLPQTLEAMGLDLAGDPERFLENGYTAYEMEPEEDPDADWRLDVYAGVTRCPVLINEYLRGESGTMDEFHRDGAVPGFFLYPLDCFAMEEERGKAVLDFRDALEAAVTKAAGEDAVTFLGGATGIFCGYLDFIAWDLPRVLAAAADFLEDSPVSWASFHTFRRNVGGIRLKKEDAEKENGEVQQAEK